MTDSDAALVDQIQAGSPQAWEEFIARFEGRLLAFVESRLGQRGDAEDVVQETFVGFLNSLPNYDRRRPLEGWLFSIAAHKLTDRLRRRSRRPTVPLATDDSDQADREVPGRFRGPSSLMRSAERRGIEESALVDALRALITRWRERGDWDKLRCIELLVVRGWPNKQVAETTGLTEQQVANYKFDFIARLQSILKRQSLPEELFPELFETN